MNTSSSDVGGSHVDFGTTTVTYNGLSQPLTMTAPAIANPVTGVSPPGLGRPTPTTASGRRTSQTVSDTTRRRRHPHHQLGLRPGRPADLDHRPDGIDHHPDLEHGRRHRPRPPCRAVWSRLHLRRRAPTADHHRHRARGRPGEPGRDLADDRVAVLRPGRAAGHLRRRAGPHHQLHLLRRRPASTTRSDRPTDPDIVVEQRRPTTRPGHPTTVTTAGGTHQRLHLRPAGNVPPADARPDRAEPVDHQHPTTPTAPSTTPPSAGRLRRRTERVDYTYDLAGRVLTTTVDNTGGIPAALTTDAGPRPARPGHPRRPTRPASTTNYTYDLTGKLVIDHRSRPHRVGQRRLHHRRAAGDHRSAATRSASDPAARPQRQHHHHRLRHDGPGRPA